jgi:hypothetical protein
MPDATVSQWMHRAKWDCGNGAGFQTSSCDDANSKMIIDADVRSLAERQVEDIRAARFSGFFPLTPALSLGERVNPTLRGVQSSPFGSPLRDARCSLSLRGEGQGEGKRRAHHPASWTISRKCRTGRVLRQRRGFPFMPMTNFGCRSRRHCHRMPAKWFANAATERLKGLAAPFDCRAARAKLQGVGLATQ